MNSHTRVESAAAVLTKADRESPALKVIDRTVIAIKAGTQFNGVTFAEETILEPPKSGLTAGRDYAVLVDESGAALQDASDGIPDGRLVLGGCHFAPGGNALARAGGDDVPAYNPYSLWDRNFRPECLDPRGMSLVQAAAHRFWCDIYLLGTDHVANGTSRFGAAIADGDDCPLKPAGGRFKRFDYDTAVAVMRHHGKGLLSVEEFFVAAYGVTEKTAHDGDPEKTGLDAPRTSKWGIMQATGNLWVWGHDGDPDEPRASIFGGSWWNGRSAGSRCANVDSWPGDSNGRLGARGRSDHLQLG